MGDAAQTAIEALDEAEEALMRVSKAIRTVPDIDVAEDRRLLRLRSIHGQLADLRDSIENYGIGDDSDDV